MKATEFNVNLPVIGSLIADGDFLGAKVIDHGVQIRWMDGTGARLTAWIHFPEVTVTEFSAARPKENL